LDLFAIAIAPIREITNIRSNVDLPPLVSRDLTAHSDQLAPADRALQSYAGAKPLGFESIWMRFPAYLSCNKLIL
jgi:hypothetical protein